MTTKEFETEALKFWHQHQIRTLKQGGTNPHMMVFADGGAIRTRAMELPDPGPNRSPLAPLLHMAKILYDEFPLNALIVVCEAWGVHNDQKSPDPVVSDTQFTADLAAKRRLEYHPLRKEQLLATLIHPDLLQLRLKEMIRNQAGVLVGLGAEEMKSDADMRAEGYLAEIRKYLVR